MKNAIETRGLTKRFRKTEAVAGLDLQVAEGRCYALLGPNGAGKTTTIKMLMNLIRPSSGTATVLGRDSLTLNVPEFQQIGYVSENQEQADWLTIEGLMNYLAPHYPSWDRDLCKRLLADFDLDPKKRIRSLSRGMKMKAALVIQHANRVGQPFYFLDVVDDTNTVQPSRSVVSSTFPGVDFRDPSRLGDFRILLVRHERIATHDVGIEAGTFMIRRPFTVEPK